MVEKSQQSTLGGPIAIPIVAVYDLMSRVRFSLGFNCLPGRISHKPAMRTRCFFPDGVNQAEPEMY